MVDINIAYPPILLAAIEVTVKGGSSRGRIFTMYQEIKANNTAVSTVSFQLKRERRKINTCCW